MGGGQGWRERVRWLWPYWPRAWRTGPRDLQGPRQAELERVREAYQDWEAAKAYFEEVSEPELVDHAIALLTACELRYAYLLRQARRQGIADPVMERVLGLCPPPTA